MIDLAVSSAHEWIFGKDKSPAATSETYFFFIQRQARRCVQEIGADENQFRNWFVHCCGEVDDRGAACSGIGYGFHLFAEPEHLFAHADDVSIAHGVSRNQSDKHAADSADVFDEELVFLNGEASMKRS